MTSIRDIGEGDIFPDGEFHRNERVVSVENLGDEIHVKTTGSEANFAGPYKYRPNEQVWAIYGGK